MNVVRQGVILIVYTFVVILMYIVLSDPIAEVITAIAAAGTDITLMPSLIQEIKTVLSLCFAIAVLIPTILFILMTFTNEEIMY